MQSVMRGTGVFGLSLCHVDAYSCHEVRTAFQLRQVGPVHRVPETPGVDVDLLLCKHQGLSCCTRKMEESYLIAVRRETLHNIQSYNYELEHLISGHADAFQGKSLLHSVPSPAGANVSVEAAVNQFYNNLFPLVYTQLINPGMDRELVWRNMGDCLRMIRQDVNPFGPHPAIMAQELVGALGAGKHLGLALAEGLEVLNATEQIIFSKECVKALVRMVYCSHCQGLTLIKPCDGFCLNVMRGCLASVSELDQPWRRYTTLLEQLTHAMANQHSMELALLGVRMHVSEALLYAQLHGPLLCVICSNYVLWPWPVDFLTYVRRSRSFFADLPELLCEGRMSYTSRVVGNGLHAQRQNPEVKVRTPDPGLAEVKDRLERFCQVCSILKSLAAKFQCAQFHPLFIPFQNFFFYVARVTHGQLQSLPVCHVDRAQG
uniref:Glypican 5c n=1 Tax=Neogobius melanostomus TaxID=47308 RepID=A0A8C6U1G0_9GOBI